MRDSHDGMPEIIGASEQDGAYFGVVGLEREGEMRRFQIGFSYASYLAVKCILAVRPFVTMPGTIYRYHFAPMCGRNEDGSVTMTVRVEQGRDSKQLPIAVTEELGANMQWFSELNDWYDAEHLRLK